MQTSTSVYDFRPTDSLWIPSQVRTVLKKMKMNRFKIKQNSENLIGHLQLQCINHIVISMVRNWLRDSHIWYRHVAWRWWLPFNDLYYKATSTVSPAFNVDVLRGLVLCVSPLNQCSIWAWKKWEVENETLSWECIDIDCLSYMIVLVVYHAHLSWGSIRKA